MYKPEDFINDADYVVKPQTNLVRNYCPYYTKWCGMKRRVCADEYKSNHPTYAEVTCCEEWLLFSNFKAWMQSQPWEGMELDKDVLVYGNKVYSPETCCFIPQHINFLFRDFSKKKELYNHPLGVSFEAGSPNAPNKKRWKAQVNTLEKVQKYLGVYTTKEEAHRVWQLEKAAVLESSMNWWQFTAEVNHSFNARVAGSVFDRAEKLRYDHAQNVESKCF